MTFVNCSPPSHLVMKDLEDEPIVLLQEDLEIILSQTALPPEDLLFLYTYIRLLYKRSRNILELSCINSLPEMLDWEQDRVSATVNLLASLELIKAIPSHELMQPSGRTQ